MKKKTKSPKSLFFAFLGELAGLILVVLIIVFIVQLEKILIQKQSSFLQEPEILFSGIGIVAAALLLIFVTNSLKE